MKTSGFISREWILWLLILAPLTLVLARWSDYPAKIPTHWNAAGEVDDYGGKGALFLSPLINTGLYLLLLLLPKIDPRKKNYNLFGGAYWIIRIALAFLLSGIGFVTCLASLGYRIDVGTIVPIAVFALFMIMGNQFARIRSNYFVGLRTPWTLNSEEVWTRTHRVTGRIWVAASAIMIVLSFFLKGETLFVVMIPYIVILSVFPFVYSWKLWKDSQQNEVK
ncbi:MAG TPA: SdpI family protein [Bacteroidia bacterium]|nr:SdpI family protein [Bacteroidia bacterium]